jgi:hypothetical protein
VVVGEIAMLADSIENYPPRGLEGDEHYLFGCAGIMKCRAIFFFILFAVLVPGDSQSQTSGRGRSINGVVLDPSGATIIGAQVRLSRDGSPVSQTATDNFRQQPLYWPCVTAFAACTEIATESGCVQTAAPLVKSRRCIVILRLPRSTSTNR